MSYLNLKRLKDASDGGAGYADPFGYMKHGTGISIIHPNIPALIIGGFLTMGGY
jgi:hypothetical protein